MKTNKEYQAKWYSKNKQKQIDKSEKRRKEIKAKIRSYKSSLKCEKCSENHPACLDFHHIDPSKKEANIYQIAIKGWSWDRIMEEIAKCQVLCANCHRKIHYKEPQ
jgi:predicted HNH restriction endonuclease